MAGDGRIPELRSIGSKNRASESEGRSVMPNNTYAKQEEHEAFYEMMTSWNEQFGQSRGYFLFMGILKLEEYSKELERCCPSIAVDPRFSKSVGLKSQVEIYRAFISIFNEKIELCEAGIKPDSVPQ